MVQVTDEMVDSALGAIAQDGNAGQAQAPGPQSGIVSDEEFGPPEPSFSDLVEMSRNEKGQTDEQVRLSFKQRVNPAPFAPIPEVGTPQLQIGSALKSGFDMAEPVALAAGGIGGAVAGGPLGGALGAAGADLLVEGAKDLARLTKGTKIGRALNVEALGPSPSTAARSVAAVREGAFDIIGAGSVPAISMFLRFGARKATQLLGVTQQALDFSVRAGRQGISLGSAQLSEGGVSELFTQTLGRFPLIGGPARQQALRAGRQALGAKARLADRIGPSETMAELGIGLKLAATKRIDAVKSEIDKGYELAFGLARTKTIRVGNRDVVLPSAVLPTRGINRVFGGIRKELIRRSSRGNDLMANTEAGRLLTEFGELGEKVTKIGPDGKPLKGLHMTLDELDGFIIRIDDALGKKITTFDDTLLLGLKKKLKESVLLLDNPEVVKQIQQADANFARIATFLEGPTATKFGRKAVKGGLRQGVSSTKAGLVEDDQLAGEVFKIVRDSPEAMKQMQKMVGPSKFRAMMRGYVDDVFARALESGKTRIALEKVGGGLDVGLIKRELGLLNPQGARAGAIRQGLEQAGVDFGEVQTLVAAMEEIVRTTPPGANAFIGRRLVLTGVRGIAGTFIIGAGASVGGGAGGIGFFPGAALVVALRSISKVISSPTLVKLANGALDRSVSVQAQANAGRVFFRAMQKEGAFDEDGGTLRALERVRDTALDIAGS